MNNIIKEIADNWKLEARQEDNNKYFFHSIQRITNPTIIFLKNILF